MLTLWPLALRRPSSRTTPRPPFGGRLLPSAEGREHPGLKELGRIAEKARHYEPAKILRVLLSQNIRMRIVLAASGTTGEGWTVCAKDSCMVFGAAADDPVVLQKCENSTQ
ncbi:hypothetical protein MPL3365_140284 [Mesorhizobium plurifarium]|uniref:Uncharacterized protein n=1 Tax=Mesorhizobium plurifarium TaxID=69974 RepID=A0A090G4U9_MESPL|nr:hypothetical protein MPL3365_140284 [Mesorhizobium plurifarium]